MKSLGFISSRPMSNDEIRDRKLNFSGLPPGGGGTSPNEAFSTNIPWRTFLESPFASSSSGSSPKCLDGKYMVRVFPPDVLPRFPSQVCLLGKAGARCGCEQWTKLNQSLNCQHPPSPRAEGARAAEELVWDKDADHNRHANSDRIYTIFLPKVWEGRAPSGQSVGRRD